MVRVLTEGEGADAEAGAEVERDGSHGRALAPPPHGHRPLGRHPNRRPRRRRRGAATPRHRRGPLRLHPGDHLAAPLLPPRRFIPRRAAGLDPMGFAWDCVYSTTISLPRGAGLA